MFGCDKHEDLAGAGRARSNARVRRRSDTVHGPIVVGLNGEPHSVAVLAWAVVRAAAGGNALVIVHVVEPRALAIDPYGMTPWCASENASEAAAALLRRAAEAAHDTAPGLHVRSRLRVGNPASVLIAEGRRAELLVIGRHVKHAWRRRLPWSVETQVRRSAAGRVIIVDSDNEVLV